MNGRVPGFGNYGFGLNRDVYGTSFSTAVASAVACLLMAYGWFSQMNIASRISLFANLCRRNAEGFPLLNIINVGAGWPLD